MKKAICDFCKIESVDIPKNLSQAHGWRSLRLNLDCGPSAQFDCCPKCVAKLNLPKDVYQTRGDDLYKLLEDTVAELIQQNDQ